MVDVDEQTSSSSGVSTPPVLQELPLPIKRTDVLSVIKQVIEMPEKGHARRDPTKKGILYVIDQEVYIYTWQFKSSRC